MAQMTLEEKMDLLDAAHAAEGQGDFEAAEKFRKQIPLDPVFAKGLLDSMGAKALLTGEFNLSEAEAAYGKNWLQH